MRRKADGSSDIIRRTALRHGASMPIRRPALLLLLPAMLGIAPVHAADGLERIEHIVVIYAENRSFDHLFGLFPGAEGLAQATAVQKTQLDHDGTPLTVLPPGLNNST